MKMTSGSYGDVVILPFKKPGRSGKAKPLEINMDGRILTCVYCGHECPQDTPASGSNSGSGPK